MRSGDAVVDSRAEVALYVVFKMNKKISNVNIFLMNYAHIFCVDLGPASKKKYLDILKLCKTESPRDP